MLSAYCWHTVWITTFDGEQMAASFIYTPGPELEPNSRGTKVDDHHNQYTIRYMFSFKMSSDGCPNPVTWVIGILLRDFW